MRILAAGLALLVTTLMVPAASAHGALTINEFDTYAISDFEGHEDSFPWEGWEIWDVYAGDGYSTELGSHGVYFKVNFAGDGSLRPTGGAVWDAVFTFAVGNETYTRQVVDNGAELSTDFEQLDWQVADGNVFQIHAWVPVPDWEGLSITDLVITTSVDGNPRDVAPGGFYDPVTGQEIPFQAPASGVFPAMGEGRIVDAVPLTGAAKWLDVEVSDDGDGAFTFNVTNPLASQGQHFMFHALQVEGWTRAGDPDAVSIDGGSSTAFTLRFDIDETVETLNIVRIHLMTDIGGLQSWYAYLDDDGVQVTDDPSVAVPYAAAPVLETPMPPLLFAGLLLGLLAWRRERS